ncbi:hypothetical protein V1522DRAFT_412530 [Lipomyces starkeyi]
MISQGQFPDATLARKRIQGISAYYEPKFDDEAAFALLDKAVELGCTFWTLPGFITTTRNRWKSRDDGWLRPASGLRSFGAQSSASNLTTQLTARLSM